MSRKHNTKHPTRVRSRYPLRLAKRGLSKAPSLPSLDWLRAKQTREAARAGNGDA